MLNRRRFLTGTVLFAGAATLGCSDDETSPTGQPDSTDGDTTDSETTESGDTPQPDVSDPGPKDGSAWFPQSVASGDPRPASVVLWARVRDPKDGARSVPVVLEVSKSEDFAALIPLRADDAAPVALAAVPAQDHCVKVRVEGLEPGTRYYYRFVIEQEGARYSSRVGRTRTAPALETDIPVRFAWVSCQDMNGRFYNAYKRLLTLDPEPDFIVHLGDYIYETTGDPSFQDAGTPRAVTFTDTAGAIVFNEGTESQYYAARSLSNYREIYQQVRADPVLQAVHERFPFIVTWDDHEFSDDAWQAHATYTDGEKDETDETRRRVASQAWSEYMPVDFPDAPDFVYDPSAPLGQDIRLYRDFAFGKHVSLFLTDLRSYRTDHLIPEDAYPGAVAADQDALAAALGDAPTDLTPLIDIDTFAGGVYKAPLLAMAVTPDKVTGRIGVSWVNSVLEARKSDATIDSDADPLPIEELATVNEPQGYTWSNLGKRGESGALGTRYFVIWDRFLAVARARHRISDGATENLLGTAQRDWLKLGITSSDRTWKIWGTPFCLTTHTVDLRSFASLPEAFRQRWALIAEDWNGAPNDRKALVEAFAETDNVVAIAGDLHSFWASLIFADETAISEAAPHLVEFAGGAITSSTLQNILITYANSDPALKAAGAAALAFAVDSLVVDKDTRPNPGVGYIRANLHGFSVADVDAGELVVTYHLMDEALNKKNLSDAEVADAFKTQRFKTDAGSRALSMEHEGGAWKRFDPATGQWL